MLPFLIIILAVLIRIYHHPHILMSDEANNMLTIKAIIEGDGIREYFFKHPPLFIGVSSLFSYPFGDNYKVIQGLSIAFSVLSFIPFYLLVKEVFDKRTALFSLLFLSILPLNIIYSTWVKQDAMLIFFFLWSLYLYTSGRYYVSGAVFGLASLVKEFAWFLPPIIVLWEILRGWEGGKAVKRLSTWLFIGAAISGWWYMFLGGLSFKAINAAALGGDIFEFSWHYPWYYYLLNLKADLTLILLPFFIIGILKTGKGIRLLPLGWLLVFYIPLSLMTVKASWYTYLASPAIGIVIAVGYLKVLDSISKQWLKWVVNASVTVFMVLNLYNLNSGMFFTKVTGMKPVEFPAKEYLGAGREGLKGRGRIALLEYNPTLQYYLGIPDSRLFYLGSQFAATGRVKLKDMADKYSIGWFVIDISSLGYVDRNLEELTYLWGKPDKVGNVLIFKVDEKNL